MIRLRVGELLLERVPVAADPVGHGPRGDERLDDLGLRAWRDELGEPGAVLVGGGRQEGGVRGVVDLDQPSGTLRGQGRVEVVTQRSIHANES